MNAVTRCLAIFAATLVVGACSGDPTASDAGAGLTIRATPGAVWVRNNTSATVNIEAIDKLGGPVEGSWAVGTIVGPLTATRDSTYQNTTAGNLGVVDRFVVTPTAEGEGSVQFTGTGGNVTVPVRVAPDTSAFNVTFSNLTPAIAETLTATAPAGTRFTSTTVTNGVNFYNSATNATSNGLAAPALLSISGDSTQLQILPAPGANGQVRFTGIVSLSTPTLQSNARSTGVVTVPALTSVAATFSNAAPAPNTSITVTMPANFKFRPTSTLTPVGAGLAAHVLSRAADSNSVVIVPVPGFNAALNITAVRFAPLGSLSLALPTSDSVNVAAIDIGADDPEAGPVGSLTVPATIGAANAAVNWDAPSFTAPDYTADGGVKAQYYLVTFANAGQYNISTAWSGAGDLDVILFPNNGNYGAGDGSEILALSAGSANPEAFNFTATAGQTVMVAVINWNGGAVNQMKIVVTRNS